MTIDNDWTFSFTLSRELVELMGKPPLPLSIEKISFFDMVVGGGTLRPYWDIWT
jgi:hypothetical protein